MAEPAMRICQECGAEYAPQAHEKICIQPMALGPCGGKILPPPIKAPNEKDFVPKRP